MLPDYPETKREIQAALRRFLRTRIAAYSPAFSGIPRFQIFEGTGSEIQRPSGDIEKTDQLSMSAALILATADVPNLTLKQVIEKLDSAALEMANQGTQQFIDSLHSVTARSGNVIEGGGRPFSAELMIEVLEKMELGCDDAGNVEFPSIFIHPNQVKSVRAADEEMQRTPELRHRYERALETKREEWRVREASRKLVG